MRRLEGLPEYDKTTLSRTVVALNLSIERPTIDAVAELFKVCGEIVHIRILRPGNPIPLDVKPFAKKYPEITDKVCALIEFEKTEFAHKAVKVLCKEGKDGMKVFGCLSRVNSMESQPMMRMPPPILVIPPRYFSSAGHAKLAVSTLALPTNVLRIPRGPEKNKEFARWCNSRMNPSPTTFATVSFNSNLKDNSDSDEGHFSE